MAWRNQRKNLLIGSALLILLAGLVSAADTDTVIIGINITQVVSIDVSPNMVNWTGLSVGETGDPEYLIVTNVGSVNITSLRANITNDATNPYGTGNPLNYNAGEFILMNQTDTGFFYVNKRNWNETIPAEVTNPTDFTEGADTGYFGIIRTAWDNDVAQEYYYFTNRTGSSGDCHTGNGELYIGKEPKNVTNQGSVDFSSSANFDTVTLDTSGIGDIDAGYFNGNCVVVTNDCGMLTLFRWNTDLETSGGCNNEANFYNESAHGKLEPGSNTWFWLEPKIPGGVPDGDVSQGTLTIIASAA